MSFVTKTTILMSLMSQMAIKAAVSCSSDSDCSSMNANTGTPIDGTYLCVSSQCQWVVGSAVMCRQSSDCGLYQQIERSIVSIANGSQSGLLPKGVNSTNLQAFLDTICDAQHCTFSSSCNVASNPFQPTVEKCCRAAKQDEPCMKLGYSLDTCDTTAFQCTASSTSIAQPPPMVCSASKTSTLWIGVLIAVLGAIANNLGLNLQKLALRKRHEKVVKQKQSERLNLAQRLDSLRLSFSNLVYKYSMGSAGSMPRGSPSPHRLTPVEGDVTLRRAKQLPGLSASEQTLQNTPEAQSTATDAPATKTSRRRAAMHQNGLTVRTGSSLHSIDRSTSALLVASTAVQEEVKSATTGEGFLSVKHGLTRKLVSNPQSAPVSAEMLEKPQFQKELDVKTLIRNPTWMLGIMIYIIANLANAPALLYAPQSIVGTLGSISLVFNVIAAPWLNHERWSYRDIIGVILIVTGSVLVVVFGGGQEEGNLDLCLLQKMFRRTDSILFLTVTTALIALSFCTICLVEANLDIIDVPLPGADDIIKETLQGELVRVAEADDSSSSGSTKGSNHVHHKTSATFVERLPGYMVKAHDKELPSGKTERTLTVEPCRESIFPSPLALTTHDLPEPSVKIGAPSPTEAPIHSVSLTVDEHQDMAFLQPGRNPRFSTSSTGNRSVHSLSLTFMIDNAKTHVPDAKMPKMTASPSLTPLEDTNRVSCSTELQIPPASACIEMSALSPEESADRKSTDSADCTEQNTFYQHPPQIHTNSLNDSRQTDDDIQVLVGGMKTSPYSDDDDEDATPTITNLDIHRHTKKPTQTPIQRLKKWWHATSIYKSVISRVKLIPRLTNKFGLECWQVVYLLPLLYATIGGLMASLTTLFVKVTANLLLRSFQGQNQYTEITPFLITGTAVFTAFMQVYWINMGLQRYDALLQIPVFYVLMTFFDVVGGGVYFEEFASFDAAQYALFTLSVTLIFAGVAVLANRLKTLET